MQVPQDIADMNWPDPKQARLYATMRRALERLHNLPHKSKLQYSTRYVYRKARRDWGEEYGKLPEELMDPTVPYKDTGTYYKGAYPTSTDNIINTKDKIKESGNIRYYSIVHTTNGNIMQGPYVSNGRALQARNRLLKNTPPDMLSEMEIMIRKYNDKGCN